MKKLISRVCMSAATLFVLFVISGNVMSVYAQSQTNKTSNASSTTGNSTNSSGNIDQLTKIMGNNTSTLKNNTDIGNPNSSTVQGMSKEGNTTMPQYK